MCSEWQDSECKKGKFQAFPRSTPSGEMQTMLNKLRTYAEKKGLTVNTAKSEVVHFNSKSVSPLQNPFTYDGVVLPKDRFKYLGMLLDRRMNPKIAEEHAVRPCMAAQSKISEFAKSHDLTSRPHAILWLSKVGIWYSCWDVCEPGVGHSVSE